MDFWTVRYPIYFAVPIWGMINLARNTYLYHRFMPGKAGITSLASGVQAHRSVSTVQQKANGIMSPQNTYAF